MFVILWEFEVKPGLEARFESVYGPEGGWARLFALSPAYLGTRLLRECQRPGVYLTLDQWSSREAYDGFRRGHAAEYAALDAAGEELTLRERHLGSFEGEAGSDAAH
ncbi:MAG: antibiotic biosynthesis monooxygenase [Acidobacteriia bacterium]|nr:antibiotic biosynthesis monooxygenase [Terriglobia bacterium]